MPSSRSPSDTPAAPRVEDEIPDLKGSMASNSRNSWIYNPAALITPDKRTNRVNATPVLNQPTFSIANAANADINIEQQIHAAIELLAGFDFVDVVSLLREKQHLPPEEAMRVLYNAIYGKPEEESPDRPTTWSQHRQQHPPATTATPEARSEEHSLPLHGRKHDAVWDQFSTSTRELSPLACSKSFNVKLGGGPANRHQQLPASLSTPTFPPQYTETITRPVRAATVSNAYNIDGNVLDQQFAAQLNLRGIGTAENGYHFLEPVERIPYNPTASAFTPTGPRHMMSRSLNTNFIGYGPASDMGKRAQDACNSFHSAAQPTQWFRKTSNYKPKSPPIEESDDHEDSGLGSSPPVPPQLNQGGTDQKRFIPMNAAMKPNNLATPPPALCFKPTMQALPNTQFSDRYLGQHTETNASANIPEDYNCATWIRNLPPDVTYMELLGSIKGAGRIWCTYINLPDYEKHQTAAAKVVFYRPESARTFLQFVWTRNPEIRGYPVKADLNRIKSAPHSLSEGTSRVLLVTGEDWFAAEDYLIEWFGQQCQFQLDRTVTHISLNGRAVIEFRFGSYRSQAEAGFKALTINRPKGFLKVEFADDPCEVGETFTSKAIALQRFQGIGV